jgi:hypothetical protein
MNRVPFPSLKGSAALVFQPVFGSKVLLKVRNPGEAEVWGMMQTIPDPTPVTAA